MLPPEDPEEEASRAVEGDDDMTALSASSTSFRLRSASDKPCCSRPQPLETGLKGAARARERPRAAASPLRAEA